MSPHTLVLKPGLVIHRIYNGYWFWGRPSVVDLWHDLRGLMSETRPDRDLGTPGLREAWNAGDHSPFHGWNKRGATKAPSATSTATKPWCLAQPPNGSGHLWRCGGLRFCGRSAAGPVALIRATSRTRTRGHRS